MPDSSALQQILNGAWTTDPASASEAQGEANMLAQAGEAAIQLAAAWETFWDRVRRLEEWRASASAATPNER